MYLHSKHGSFSDLSYWFMFVIFRRKIYDEYNDEEVELTKQETKLIRRLLKGKAPHAEFDPYAVCIILFLSNSSYKAFFQASCFFVKKFLKVSCMYCSLMLIGLPGMVLNIRYQMHQNQRGVLFLQNGRVKR